MIKKLLFLLLFSLTTMAQTNLVPNGGFETWTTSTTLSNWIKENSVTQNTSTYIEGIKSAQLSITNSATPPRITAQVPMTAGTTYTVKFKYKYVSANYSSLHPITLNISKNGSATTLSSSTFASNNNWTVKETTFTPDQNLSYDLSISTFTFDAAAFNVIIDDVQVYIKGTEQYTLIPDVNFENKLISLGIDSGVADGKVLTNYISNVQYLDMSNSSTSDLTGIQDFAGLISLDCRQTGLKIFDVSKNINLRKLDCTNNALKTLDVSKNINLKFLDCSSNALAVLDVTSNTLLQYLSCDNNGGHNTISTLDLSKNIDLIELNISRLYFSNIDISNNLALKKIDLSDNSISTLNLSKNTLLETIFVDNNNLSTLDLSKNKLLKELKCDSNKLTSLNLSANNSLIFLDCSNNKLNSLNLKNGNNSKLIKSNLSIGFMRMYASMGLTYDSSFKGNANLNCIQIDDFDYSQTNWSTLKEDYSYFTSLDCGLSTNILDPKFEDKLISLLIDKDGKNGAILNSSISTITSLDVSNSSIADLSGIQGFTALKTLKTSNNALKKLDLSKNTYLNSLNSSNNPALTCIQVADLVAAAKWTVTKDAKASLSLDCNSYTLIPDSKFEDYLIEIAVDRDGKNGKVVTENIDKITSLDLSQLGISDLTGIQDFTSLTKLSVNYNKLTKLDVSNNTALVYLDCSNNAITQINMSKNTNLAYFFAGQNSFVSLDVSKNLELSRIWCQSNQIRSLDFSKNLKLIELIAGNNKLVNLNIKNGTNNNLSVGFTGNSDLKCIQVDNVDYSNTNWSTKKDATAVYSSDPCPLVIPYTLIPDSKFEDKLIALQIDKDGKNGKVETMSIVSLASLNVSNSNITDLTGIEDFTLLNSLDCNTNQLKTINVSKNLALTSLNVSNNQLTTLDINKNSSLIDLNCSYNALTSLYLDINSSLSILNCNHNVLNYLSVLYNSKLSVLSASFNKIKNLDISKNLVLKEVNCAANDLYNLNLKNGNNANMQNMIFGNFTENPNLLCIQVDDVAFSTDKWIAKDAIANYSTEACGLHTGYIAIPDSKFEDKLIALKIDKDGKNGKVATFSINTVTSLNISNSEISNLTGIEGFTLLSTLDCSNNLLKTINVSNNLSLTNLNVSKNQLTALDVSKNASLTVLSASINKIRYLDVSKNSTLKEFDCAINDLYNLNLKNGNNANMQRMIFGNFTENPNLLCIEVDNPIFSNDKWIAKDATANYSSQACPINLQYTLIPDANFENILIANGIDKDGPNGKVLTSSIINLKYVYALDLINKITDLTGIEDFASLEELYCYHGAITKLDLSKNLKLKVIDIADNKISTLDLSKNKDLESINCGSNNLTVLNVSNNLVLKTLIVDNNKLTNIDVSKNSALTRLDIGSNQLTDVDLSANTNLTSLGAYSNKVVTLNISKNIALTSLDIRANTLLTSIDVSKNIALTYLNSSSCQITAIDISKNKALNTLDVSNNKIEKLDISQNPSLTSLSSNSNQLNSLNLRNGKNSLLTILNLKGNSKLYCILVDDVTYSNTNWLNKKDALATFNTECTGELKLPSNNFTITSKSETCLNSNNGEINIKGTATFAYNATINGQNYSFVNNSLTIPNLTPGVYTVSVTITGEIFEQNFTITIPKGATITGKSSLVANKVAIDITEGTAPYTVFVNGAPQFETNEASFIVDFAKNGLLEVKTAKACEGVYAKNITGIEAVTTVSAYPNPTLGSFEIALPTLTKEVVIELYNLSSQLISKGTYTNENGKVKLSLEQQTAGVYIAKVYLDTPEYLKIIKK